MIYSGPSKIKFCNRLGDDWKALADYLGIHPADQSRFERGDEARDIWEWLENRNRLQDLPAALPYIQREDLVDVLQDNRTVLKGQSRNIIAAIGLSAVALIGFIMTWMNPAPPRIQVSYYHRPAGQSELRTLPPGSELRSGDHYKIWFTPEQDSYVYIFQIDSNQDIYCLFPRESLQGIALNQTNPVKAGRQYQLPADDKAFVLPDDRLGQEKIYVLAFKEPNTVLEQLYNALEQARQQQNITQIADRQYMLLTRLQQETPAVSVFTFIHLEKK